MLKVIRDENAIHPKLPGQGISYRKLAKYFEFISIWGCSLPWESTPAF
jgi:hypothetical protein